MRNIIKKILKESEFDWVDDIINQPLIKVGDVYYIVDGFVVNTDAHPMDYKPEKVRYLFHVTKVFEENGDFYLEYEYCDPNQVTYNPKDYNSSRCNYYTDDAYSIEIEYEDALDLINNSYWRLMGNNGTSKNINESEFDWLPDQGEIGLKVRVNEKPFHIKKPIHRQDEGIFKSRCSWSGCYEIVGEEIFTGIDCYIIELSVDYPEVYFPKKAFLEKDFCSIDDTSNRLFESGKDEVNSNCVGINLSNLTTDEKIKVLEKLEQVYNTFVGFSRYAWVDQIQYLITDFTTPVLSHQISRSLRNKCGKWFTSVPEDAYKEETDSYEVPVSMDGTKVRWSKEIDGREFLNMSFIDDTSKLFESEEDFGWAEDLVKKPFHYQLMKDNPKKPVSLEDVKYIMFNPPVEVGDRRFNKIAYFLEDNDYYPNTLESFGKKTSYIEITKWIKRTINVRQNGKWNIGPELSEQELYNFSQTENNGKYWAEEFEF